MTRGQGLKFAGATVAFAGVVLAGMFLTSPRGRAQDSGDDAASRIEQGFEIAPVPLNLDGKNRSLVGLEAISSTGRATAMLATTPDLGTINSCRAETHSLASRRSSIRQPTSAAAGISVRSTKCSFPRTSSPVT